MVFGNFDLNETSVANSRFFKRSNIIWRRRKTKNNQVFTTRESVDLSTLSVGKKDGAQEQYSPSKLLLSILGATDHLESSKSDAWHLMQTVELKMLGVLDEDMVIDTSVIADICMETLKNFNAASHVKYASYQTDISGKRELKRLVS